MIEHLFKPIPLYLVGDPVPIYTDWCSYRVGPNEEDICLRVASEHTNGDRMDFSQALLRLKDGSRVTRNGWNKPHWLILVPGSTITVEKERPLGKAVPDMVGKQLVYAPHIDIKTAEDVMVPWIASQSDLLANDWVVLNG